MGLFRFTERWNGSLRSEWQTQNPLALSPVPERLFQALDARDRELEAYLEPGEWLTPTAFLNGWVDYGVGNRTTRFRKVGDIVYIEGLVKNGTLTNAVFQLPPGFRPPQAVQFAVASNTAFGYTFVDANGYVYAWAGSNVWFSLNISFSVTP